MDYFKVVSEVVGEINPHLACKISRNEPKPPRRSKELLWRKTGQTAGSKEDAHYRPTGSYTQRHCNHPHYPLAMQLHSPAPNVPPCLAESKQEKHPKSIVALLSTKPPTGWEGRVHFVIPNRHRRVRSAAPPTKNENRMPRLARRVSAPSGRVKTKRSLPLRVPRTSLRTAFDFKNASKAVLSPDCIDRDAVFKPTRSRIESPTDGSRRA
jgi:hypothetical protein